MTDRIADIYGLRTPHARGTVWPARVDQYLEPGVEESSVESWVQAACLLLHDLQDLHVLASLVQTTWTVIAQGAQGLRDRELLDVAQHANSQTSRQLRWLDPRMKSAAPQALIVDP